MRARPDLFCLSLCVVAFARRLYQIEDAVTLIHDVKKVEQRRVVVGIHRPVLKKFESGALKRLYRQAVRWGVYFGSEVRCCLFAAKFNLAT